MLAQETLLPLDGAARKPDGGFTFITVTQLAMAWWAYERGVIRFLDLRTYFACWELVARRCELERGQRPDFGPAEVHKLTGGVGGEHTRHSLRRLQAAGLLSFSQTSIRFAASPDAMPGELAGFWELLAKIENNRRKVPVPRRVVRFIAGGAGRVVTATILGHLLRCVYYRGGQCKPIGNCKASWVADVFGVSAANVKAARVHLAELGLFVLVEMPQWHRNRWGARVAFNLRWGGAVGRVAGEERPRSEIRPPGGLSTTDSRPPCLNQNPLPERKYKNQKPGSAWAAGVSAREREEGRPSLRNVVAADLRDTARLLELWDEAGRRGIKRRTQLDFVALAVHAANYATKNAPGLFAWLLRNEKFTFITHDDEDEANRRLKEHFYGEAKPRRAVVAAPAKRAEPPPLSDLARYALAVQRVVTERRILLDPFTVARQHRPGITREEWETALAELEQSRLDALRSSCPEELDEPVE